MKKHSTITSLQLKQGREMPTQTDLTQWPMHIISVKQIDIVRRGLIQLTFRRANHAVILAGILWRWKMGKPQYFSMLFVFLFVPPFSPPFSVCGSDSSSGGAFTHLMHLVSHLTCCQSTHQPQYKSPGLSCSDRQIVHSATLVEILATHNSQWVTAHVVIPCVASNSDFPVLSSPCRLPTTSELLPDTLRQNQPLPRFWKP